MINRMCDDPVQLTICAKQGDKEAFGVLVRIYQSVIFNIAFRLLGDEAESEDVTQETFIRAYQSLKSFDQQRPLAPWLKKITVNLCLDRMRHIATFPLEESVPASTIEPETHAIQSELSYQIHSVLLTLPPRFRVVIELRHFQEMSYEEIAKTLSRPLSIIKTDLFRARKLLSERLKEVK